jgi:hypothetical protein
MITAGLVGVVDVSNIQFGPWNAVLWLLAIVCLGLGIAFVLAEDRDIF